MKHITSLKQNFKSLGASKSKILILSHDQNGIDVLTKALAEKYILYTPGTISKAFEILCHEDIALIIADQLQTATSGMAFLEAAMYISKKSIRIFFGDYNEVANLTAVQSEGVFHYFLNKPLSIYMINTVIGNALELYAANEKIKTLSEDLEIANRMMKIREQEHQNFEEQKKRFMLIANHELRTPATIISSSLDILNTKLNNFDETEKKLLTSAKTGVSRLNDTLENIYLMLSANENKEMVYNSEINFSGILFSLKDKIQEHLKKRNISMKIICPDSITMIGQKQRILQLFDNLLSNAIKYTHDGGTVIIQVRIENSNIFVTIKDSGIGIPAIEQNNIFKSFYQLGNLLNHHSSKYDFLGKGSGLGLPICKNIVKQHAGEIWAESEGENKGSTISIKFPARNNNIIGLPRHKKYAKAV